MTRILLVDDHNLFIEGLTALMKGRPKIELVGQAKDGEEAFTQAKKLKPDIILMDIAMPETNGIKAARHILKEFPDMKIIVLSMYNNSELIIESLRAGAAGYVLKECESEELYEAIQTVMDGNYYIAKISLEIILKDYLRLLREEAKNSERILSEREKEVLRLLAAGKNAKEIAYDLGISRNTVDVHRRHIMEKTGCNSMASLVRYAIREGY